MLRIFPILFLFLLFNPQNCFAFANMFTQMMGGGSLTANGGNCSAGSYPLGVDASGAVESCTDATTEIDSAVATHSADTLAQHGIADTSKLPTTIKQTVSLGDDGVLTPTPGYDIVKIDLTCTGSSPTPIVLTEGGSETVDSHVSIRNIGATSCSFAHNDTVFFSNCGSGKSVQLSQFDTLDLERISDRWVQDGGTNDTFCASSLNIESKPINGAIKTIEVTAATYAMGTFSGDSWGSVILNADNDALGVTMETAVAGQSFCVRNKYGVTAALTLTPNTGDYLMDGSFGDGTRGTAATAYVSSGAAGDEICIYCEDATYCSIRKEVGTWSE